MPNATRQDESHPDLVRKQTLESLCSQTLDVLVIGGGIVGAGIARDAAMRGLKVGLVEQYDLVATSGSR